jgi:hypothetical protein
MSPFDADIGWMKTTGMEMCVCTHLQKSHRPMSRTCCRCNCRQFTVNKNPPVPVSKSNHPEAV